MGSVSGRIARLETKLGLDLPRGEEVKRPKRNPRRELGNMIVGLLSVATLYGLTGDDKARTGETLKSLLWHRKPPQEVLDNLAGLLCEIVTLSEDERRDWFFKNFPMCHYPGPHTPAVTDGPMVGGWSPRMAARRKRRLGGKKKKGAGMKGKKKSKKSKSKTKHGGNGFGKVKWAQ